MEKNTVTRTFSIGAIYSRSGATDDGGHAARRHSSAGIRALLWATTNAKSLGSSTGSEWQASRENIYPNILTPDSIPQFTIPRLSLQNSVRSLDREMQLELSQPSKGLGRAEMELDSSSTCSSSSSSSLGLSLLLSERRAERSVSDPSSRRRSLLQREASHPCCFDQEQHCLDAASRAAFSLPHLAKVTTPYGFVTLSQSPQMASEEALLCQAALRRFHKGEDQVGCASKVQGVKAVDSDSQLSGDEGERKDSADASVTGSWMEKGRATPPQTVNSSRKPKKRFYKLIRKHFTSLGVKSQSD